MTRQIAGEVTTSVANGRAFAKPNRPLAALICIFAGLAGGCAYRFTNAHIVRPEGIRTVAVEAVYDTSREVLPHEHLWTALQDAFASDGHLRLAPQSSADALVRAHIKQANVGPTGSEGTDTEPRNDPDPYTEATPPSPGAFRELSHAAKTRPKAAVSVVVDVEVWSLRTRTLLLKQTYGGGGAFHANYYGLPSSAATADYAVNDHLRFNEATEARFKALSENIARSVVRDLLVR